MLIRRTLRRLLLPLLVVVAVAGARVCVDGGPVHRPRRDAAPDTALVTLSGGSGAPVPSEVDGARNGDVFGAGRPGPGLNGGREEALGRERREVRAEGDQSRPTPYTALSLDSEGTTAPGASEGNVTEIAARGAASASPDDGEAPAEAVNTPGSALSGPPALDPTGPPPQDDALERDPTPGWPSSQRPPGAPAGGQGPQMPGPTPSIAPSLGAPLFPVLAEWGPDGATAPIVPGLLLAEVGPDVVPKPEGPESLWSEAASDGEADTEVPLTQDQSTEGTLTQDQSTEGTLSQDQSTEGTLSQDQSTEGTLTQDQSTEGTLSQDQSTEGTLSQDQSTVGTLTQDQSTEGTLTQDQSTEGTMSSEDLPLIFDPFDDVTPQGSSAATGAAAAFPEAAAFDRPVTVETDGDDGPSRPPPPPLLLRDWPSPWQTSGTELLLEPSTSTVGAPEQHAVKDSDNAERLEEPSSISGLAASSLLSAGTPVTKATHHHVSKSTSGLEEMESEEESDEDDSEEEQTNTPASNRPPYSLIPPPPVWVQRNQGLMRSWMELIREKAGYVSGMLVPVGIGIAGAILIVGALNSIRMIHRRRRNSFKYQRRKVRQQEQPRETGPGRPDQAMLLADSSEDEF